MALNNQSSAKDVLVDADLAAVRAERVRANLKWREWIVKQSGTTGLTGTPVDLRDAR
jgi:hypothetical protein